MNSGVSDGLLFDDLLCLEEPDVQLFHVVPALLRPCASSSLRFFVPALLFGSLLAPTLVYAGTYVGTSYDYFYGFIPYSGGVHGVRDADPNSTGTMHDVSDAMSDTGYGGGSGGGSSSSCSGAITTTWVWQHGKDQNGQDLNDTNDPPPSQVLVTETCTASVGEAIPFMIGYYDTGMGKTDTVTCFPGGNNNSISGTSIRYSSHAGGASVSLPSVSPSASGSGYGSSCTVSYSASINPILVNLSGVAVDGSGKPILDSSGNDQILVGQGCTSSLIGIPSACIVSNSTWGVTGTTFQSWTVSADQTTTTEVDGPGRSDQPTARWFWNDYLSSGRSKIEQVTCTATVTPPPGQGAAFTVTVAQPVTVWVPKWTASGTGDAMYLVNKGSDSPNWLFGAFPSPGSTDKGGMNWEAFVFSPVSGLFGDGAVSMVQLVVPNRSEVVAGNPYHVSNNGQMGLDTRYPYGLNTINAGPNFYSSYDTPSLSMSQSTAGPIAPIEVYSASMQDKFQDILLYTPSGSSQCVPIAQFVWYISGNVTEPNQNGFYNWSYYGPGAAGIVHPSSRTNFYQTSSFPSWTQNSGNGSFSWMNG